MTTELVPVGVLLEQTTRLAAMGFLARYRGATLRAYSQDAGVPCGGAQSVTCSRRRPGART